MNQRNGTSAPAPVTLKIKTLENFSGDLPAYESEWASGFDVRAQLSEPLALDPGQRCLVPTGLSFEIPKGFEIQARPRSGLAIKKGISLVNTPGTIDADYRGEVQIILINLGKEAVTISSGERIAQLVLCPVVQAQFVQVETLGETSRGEGGFGSTGV
ncbi:dUTP diphosphatase [bacterium]|nr:dUTP diphosphatase [bacterium]